MTELSDFPSGEKVMAAMELLGITAIQTCPQCSQMWVNLNDEKCRKCGAQMAYTVS